MTLTAVPTPRRSPTQLHREDQFRRRVEDAIGSMGGDDAVAEIVRLYIADTGAMEARMQDAQTEASTASRDARSRYDMLQQCHGIASQGILRQAALTAEVSACRSALEQVQAMAQRADGIPVQPEQILAAVAVQPPRPVFIPTVFGFSASARFRAGHFVADAQDVHFHFTFLGYALVDHGPGAAGIIEPVFLVGDRSLPLSMVEGERRVKLREMLPARGPVGIAG